MFTYKNISPFFYIVPGVGEVEPGGTIESDIKLENANLELIDNPLQPATAIAAPTIAPALPPVTATVVAPTTPATNEVKQ